MTPKNKKILLGCGLGCGGLIVLVFVPLLIFFLWLRSPGELLEPGRLIGEDTVGYAEWTLSLEDPGTEQFVEDLLDAMQEHQSQATRSLPGPLAALGQFQQRRDRRKFREMFPMVVAWTLSRGEESGDRDHLLSVSLQKIGNGLVLADWLMGLMVPTENDELIQVPYLDERIYTATGQPDPLTFFLRGNDFFLTRSLEASKHAVERLQPRPAGERRAPAVVDELFARAPTEMSFRGALSNENGEIYDLWSQLALAAEDPDQLRLTASELRGVVVSGRLSAERTFEGRIALQGPDPAWSQDFMDDALSRFRDGLAYEGMQLGAEVSRSDEWIIIEFRIVASFDPIRLLLERAFDDARRQLPDDVVVR